MENQELDIRILRYLNGEMTASEITSFEERLSLDVALKQKVAAYKKLEEGVKKYGKDQMKADLLAAQTSVIGTKSLGNYKPSINGGGGFNIFSFLVKTLIIGSIASAILIYLNKMPFKHELFETVHEKMHVYDTLFEVKYDTVWHTVPSQKVKKGDTIIIRNQKDLEQFENEYEL